MKILIVVPKYVQKSYSYYNFPLGLGYVAAMAKKYGSEVVGLNLNETNHSIDESLNIAIKKEKPDIVATGSLSGWIDQIGNIFQSVKKVDPSIICVVGGGMLSGEPEPVMRAIKADYGIIGEGEQTFVELIDKIKCDKDKRSINGLVYWNKKKELIRNLPREAIMDIDSLPWPEYDLLGLPSILERQSPTDAFFLTAAKEQPRKIDMITSRSCPFSCTFCFHPAGKVYRERSLDKFFEELIFYKKKYRINTVAIVDELFSLKRQRLIEFCERIEPLNLKWVVQLHVNSVDKETIKLMKKSGCDFISYGIESMDQSVLESMKKKSKVERVNNALRLSNKEKVAIQGNLIFGDSVETVETANNTFKWWNENREMGVNISTMQVWPGSPIYIEAVRNGLINDRDNFVKNLPIFVNVSSMNNKDRRNLDRVIHSYNVSAFNYPEKLRFKQSKKELPHRGKSYDFEYECPSCKKQNKVESCVIDDDVWPHFRMYCGFCFSRVDIQRPDWLYDNEQHHEKLILYHAELAEKSGDFPKALEILDLLIKNGKRSTLKAHAYYKKSLIFDKFNHLESRFDSLIGAIKILPNKKEYHLLIADVLFLMKIYGGAILHLNRALDIEPKYNDAKKFLNFIYSKTTHEQRKIMFSSISDDPPPVKKKNDQRKKIKIRHKDKLMLANGRYDIEPEFTHLEPT